MLVEKPIIRWILIVILLGLGHSLDSHAQDGSSDVSSNQAVIPTLTVCEALSHPAEYDGRIVRIRDQVVGTDEGTSFFGESCPGIYVTEGKVWPTAIAWTMPWQKDAILHPVDFSFDWSNNKTVKRKWEKLRKHVPDRCIAVMYTGMLEVWTKTNARKPRGQGWVEIPGFGHLNGAPAQLVLKSADDVAAIPNCTAQQ
jgi:hypothetical protein